jgi:hypothetical protein
MYNQIIKEAVHPYVDSRLIVTKVDASRAANAVQTAGKNNARA